MSPVADRRRRPLFVPFSYAPWSPSCGLPRWEYDWLQWKLVAYHLKEEELTLSYDHLDHLQWRCHVVSCRYVHRRARTLRRSTSLRATTPGRLLGVQARQAESTGEHAHLNRLYDAVLRAGRAQSVILTELNGIGLELLEEGWRVKKQRRGAGWLPDAVMIGVVNDPQEAEGC